MTDVHHYGVLSDPTTLTIKRLMPAGIDRVWAYLTESDLRRRWFAAGEMPAHVGDAMELVWRNNELTDPPGRVPEGAGEENRMQTRITELDPPHRLAIAWGDGDVTFDLAEQDGGVLLTLTHTGIADRAKLLNFAPGWHVHLDLLQARLADTTPEAFWDGIARLKQDYAARLAA
ncbi:MAG: SRPBCC family protein [Phenylobacterium sp.]|uniref:SRPBCC family protein n=1 Tax=Phenylobacterium sp. TaxID=1871053 RepID=UPI0027376163|nr:SRPBCC family protein [Phenylobacterium sp.]MDP3749542.1 SRPBCC family protein [Phenylobacterium sp.]